MALGGFLWASKQTIDVLIIRFTIGNDHFKSFLYFVY
jgi:hypothetical protein